jgi:serine protease Do
MMAGAARADHLADAYAAVKQAVVTVYAVEGVQTEGSALPHPMLSTGSGVFVGAQVLVLTAAHVVQSADEIAVEFRNGRRYPARVIASEPQADVAMLALQEAPRDISAPIIGDSDALRIGDEIFAVGTPHGLGDFLSAGRVSARHGRIRLTPTLTLAEFFLTDAFIDEGQSGGPVFDQEGAIVGIVSRTLAAGESPKTVGLVISAATIKRYLLARRSPWTGFQASWVEGRVARALNLPQERGLLVEGVAEGSLASALGLRPGTVQTRVEGQLFASGGDVVLGIQSITLVDDEAYEQAMASLCAIPDGEPVRMRVLRGGRQLELAARYTDHCRKHGLYTAP